LDFKPLVTKPHVSGIPRYAFYWYYRLKEDEEETSTVWAEVDAAKRELKCLFYDDKYYWSQYPPIDVPILLPALPRTNQPPVRSSSTPPARKAPRQRLDHPVPLPR
jgi:hypothetical protein